MRLEAYPIGENDEGMAQVQSLLVAMTIQLYDLVKVKEKHKEVLCVTCRKKGHQKNECPLGVWCEICKTMGHHPTAFPLMQKY
jgi:hypothetical protein